MNGLISLNLRLHNRDSRVHLVAMVGNEVGKSSRAWYWAVEDDSSAHHRHLTTTVRLRVQWPEVSALATVTNVYGGCSVLSLTSIHL